MIGYTVKLPVGGSAGRGAWVPPKTAPNVLKWLEKWINIISVKFHSIDWFYLEVAGRQFDGSVGMGTAKNGAKCLQKTLKSIFYKLHREDRAYRYVAFNKRSETSISIIFAELHDGDWLYRHKVTWNID